MKQGIINLISGKEWVGIVLAMVTAVGGVWNISSHISSIDTRVQHLEESFQEIKKSVSHISSIDTRVQHLDASFQEVKTSISHLDKNISRVEIATGILLGTESPLTINEKGLKIANEINADAIFDKYWPIFKKSIDDANVNTPYDIQDESISIASDLDNILTDAEIKTIKEVAYKNGVLYRHIFSIFAIKIRDRVLKEREYL